MMALGINLVGLLVLLLLYAVQIVQVDLLRHHLNLIQLRSLIWHFGLLLEQIAHVWIEGVAEDFGVAQPIANRLPILVAHGILMASGIELARFDSALNAKVACSFAVVVLVEIRFSIIFDYFGKLIMHLIFNNVPRRLMLNTQSMVLAILNDADLLGRRYDILLLGRGVGLELLSRVLLLKF